MYFPHQPSQRLASWREHRAILFAVLLLGLVAVFGVATLLRPNAASPGTQLNLQALPLSFVPNVGQADTAVHYQTHDMGSTIFFASDEVVLSLPGDGETATVRLHFEGANATPAVQGGQQLPGVVNYLVGNDPAQWRTGVPTYGGIVYEQLYPGIDLFYEGNNGRLKGTYVVAPGADPAQIRWSHSGAADVAVDPGNGSLVIDVAGGQGTVIEEAPVAWQEINGRRQAVSVHYAVAADGQVSFALGAYDPAHALTIDPAIVYSTFVGGTNFEDVESIAVDGAGSAYITGTTDSGDFPTRNPLQSNKRGDEDAYVAKLNAAGDALVYATFIGGNGDDEGYDIAVDGAGNAYVTGTTDSDNFPTENAAQNALQGFTDAYVIKLNAAGDALVYGTYLGGSNLEEGEGLALDGAGNVYVTGATGSADFPTQNPVQSSLGGGMMDGFVAKINAAGDSLVYSTYLGGNSMDTGSDIVVDGSGVAYVVGDTQSADFPTQSAFRTVKAGDFDTFVAKLNAAGDSLVYSTYLGGNGKEVSYGIGIDGAGNAYVAGETESSDFPTENALQATNQGYADAYVTKLNSSGTGLIFSTYLGGNDADRAYGLAVDGAGDAYVVGTTSSTNFPTANAVQPSLNGGADAFIAKVAADGSARIYSTFLGGQLFEQGDAVAVDNSGNVYVAGITGSNNFPTENALQGNFRGLADVFVAKISDAGDVPPTPTPDPSASPTPTPPATPPNPRPSLAGSLKYASQVKVGPDDELTYTIRLHNSGTAGAIADVSDRLPEVMTLVDGSISDGGSYDAATRTVSWDDVAVAAGDDVFLTFAVTADVPVPTRVINTAVITPQDGNPIERSFPVLVLPDPVSDDVSPPVVESVIIGDQDVLDDPNVTLHIEATDDQSVAWMYIAEWHLRTAPVPRWERVTTSGWVPYEAEYDWTLTNSSGAHFVGVWVADAGLNVSWLDQSGLDYASLVLPGETVGPRALVPYLVHYEAGTNVSATVTPTSGDADLFVWYPNNFWLPDKQSSNTGTAVEEINFVAPSTGTYLFLVRGRTGATYDIGITPAGGPNPWPMAAGAASAPTTAEQASLTSSENDVTVNILNASGMDPLSSAEAPEPPASNQRPILKGSTKFASQKKAGPNDQFTYTIRLHNSGTEAATADVVDALPDEVTLVDGSISGGGSYDATSRTISWNNVAVPLRDSVDLTFDVTAADLDDPKVVVNVATITPEGEESFERRYPVLIVPVPVDDNDDVTRPTVDSVLIDDQDVLTDENVVLHINASDDVGVEWMYIVEWHLTTTPAPRWERVETTGWIPYEAEYPWTLDNGSGTYFVGVWVADAAANVSRIDRSALDYASLVLPNQTVEQRRLVPYLVHYEAGTDVTATLSPTAGEADLFVWFPDSFLLPDEYSVSDGADEVTFTAPSTGMYLFVVRARAANATYDLTITPAGGPEPRVTAAGNSAALTAVDAGPVPQIFSVLLDSGLDPLAEAEEPAPPDVVGQQYRVYMPIMAQP